MSTVVSPTFTELPIPPSVNGIWRAVRTKRGRTRVIMSKPYAAWLGVAVPLLRAGMDKVRVYPVCLVVRIRAGKGWRQGRDLSNALKAIEDACKHAERIADDNTEYVTGIRMTFTPAERGKPAACFVGVEQGGT